MTINKSLKWEAQKNAFSYDLEQMLIKINVETEGEQIEKDLHKLRSIKPLEKSLLLEVTFDNKRKLTVAYQKLLSIFADSEVQHFFSGRLPKKTAIKLTRKVTYQVPATDSTPPLLLYITKEYMTYYKSDNLSQIHTPYGSVIEVAAKPLESHKKSPPYKSPFA